MHNIFSKAKSNIFKYKGSIKKRYFLHLDMYPLQLSTKKK